MAIKLNSNFDYRGSNPNFERDVVETFEELKNLSGYPDGHLVYCKETKLHYKYNEELESGETGKFEEFKAGGVAIVDSVDKLDPNAPSGSLATVSNIKTEEIEVEDKFSVRDIYVVENPDCEPLMELRLKVPETWPTSDLHIFFGQKGYNSFDEVLEGNSLVLVLTSTGVNIEIYINGEDGGYGSILSDSVNEELLNEVNSTISSWGGIVFYGTVAFGNEPSFIALTKSQIDYVDSIIGGYVTGTHIETIETNTNDIYFKETTGWRKINDVKIVDSVDKLDKNAPQGSLASVAVNTGGEVLFSELYQPTSDEVNLENMVVDTTNLSSVSGIAINSSYDTSVEPRNFIIYLFSKDFDIQGGVGQMIALVPGMAVTLNAQGENEFELFTPNDDGTIAVNEENLTIINNLLSSTEFVYGGVVISMESVEFLDPSYADVFYKSSSGEQKTELYIKDIEGWIKFSDSLPKPPSIINSLEIGGVHNPLSAEMGKVLAMTISELEDNSLKPEIEEYNIPITWERPTTGDQKIWQEYYIYVNPNGFYYKTACAKIDISDFIGCTLEIKAHTTSYCYFTDAGGQILQEIKEIRGIIEVVVPRNAKYLKLNNDYATSQSPTASIVSDPYVKVKKNLIDYSKANDILGGSSLLPIEVNSWKTGYIYNENGERITLSELYTTLKCTEIDISDYIGKNILLMCATHGSWSGGDHINGYNLFVDSENNVISSWRQCEQIVKTIVPENAKYLRISHVESYLASMGARIYDFNLAVETLHLPDYSVTKEKIADEAIMFDKLSIDIQKVLAITMQNLGFIIFKDKKIRTICLTNWDADGDGLLTEEEVSAVTDISGVFKNNKEIVSFGELSKFTNLTSIPERAFYDCASLTTITIPESVTSIGEAAFYNCIHLTSINIPESVTSIGGNVFSSCRRLTNITIPKNVTSIGGGAFGYCRGLTSVHSYATTPPTLGNNAFYSIPTTMSIYVPDASVDTYKAAPNWSSYASQIKPMSEYVES